MAIEEKILPIQIVEKQEKTKGLFKKRPAYLVSILPAEGFDITEKPTVLEIPVERYRQLEEGQRLNVAIYSPDKGGNWFFSRQMAYRFEKFYGKAED